jgi:hypothetical protein
MAYERTGYAPWSLTREAGVESATVDGTIKVPQYCQPTLDTGFVDEKGNWQGRKSDDRNFIGITKADGIANGGVALFPDTNSFPSVNMTGFNDIIIAIKPSSGGNYAIKAIMGPDTTPFANLTPVNSGATLQGAVDSRLDQKITDIFNDDVVGLDGDVWNIYYVKDRLLNQKNMQFKLTNNSGGASNIEFGFMRMV